jgi:hypothetical protein
MQTSKGRASFGNILPGQGDEKLEENSCSGAPNGMAPFLRENPRRNDDQPQEWKPVGQPTPEFRTGDIHRTNPSLDVRSGSSSKTERIGAISWVICGCESGQGARPFDLEWARKLKNQCVDAHVPFFFKQARINGKLVKMPELDGKVWGEYPCQS